MKAKVTFFLLMGLISWSTLSFSQKKVAVIISGNPLGIMANKDIIPDNERWGQGNIEDADEFWNDTFLLWELLTKQYGYLDQNVHVLFSDGKDYPRLQYNTDYPTRYDPHRYGQEITITQCASTINNVYSVFQNLDLQDDDFLFIYILSHGFHEIRQNDLQHHWYIYMEDGKLYDDELAVLINSLHPLKKVLWFQPCYSGGFASYYLNELSVVFNSAAQDSQNAHRCDDFAYTDPFSNPPDHSLFQTSKESDDYGFSMGLRHHCEFTYHMYSSTKGEIPYGGDYEYPLTSADINGDDLISVYEAYEWENAVESCHESIPPFYCPENPYYQDPGNIGNTTSLQYPTLIYNNITSNKFFKGIIGITKDVHVTTGHYLVFDDDADVYLSNNASLIIDDGATLTLHNNVKILGGENNHLEINGNLIMEENIEFTKREDAEIFNGVFLNESSNVVFDKVHFNHAQLVNNSTQLIITNSLFENSMINSNLGNIDIENCNFERCATYFGNQSDNYNTVIIEGCSFISDQAFDILTIWNYPNFFISQNSIQGSLTGINIVQSGYGPIGNQNLINNTFSDCSWMGIRCYNSTADITMNKVFGTSVGVGLYNRSHISFYGNPSATNNSQTQHIYNNSSYELYSDATSFPWYFRFNAIIDEDNLGQPLDPLIYYDYNGDGVVDVRYNCFGEQFNYLEDLYRPYVFNYNPGWCPFEYIGNDTIQDKVLYDSAREQFESGNYNSSKVLYHELVWKFPHSLYSEAALKDLLSLEKFAGNDYYDLQQYYLSNDSILSDTTLAKLGDFLANKCNVQLENWLETINWYEEKIQNPEIPEDTLYSIIDLGYTYLLMDSNETKSSYIGRYPRYKPLNKESFFKYRDYLLSLLPFDNMSESMTDRVKSLRSGELLQNVPNPFNEGTQFWFRIKEESEVVIKISDLFGKELMRITLGTMDKGTHKFDYCEKKLIPGVYLYSLILDGIFTDTKKMVVIK